MPKYLIKVDSSSDKVERITYQRKLTTKKEAEEIMKLWDEEQDYQALEGYDENYYGVAYATVGVYEDNKDDALIKFDFDGYGGDVKSKIPTLTYWMTPVYELVNDKDKCLLLAYQEEYGWGYECVYEFEAEYPFNPNNLIGIVVNGDSF